MPEDKPLEDEQPLDLLKEYRKRYKKTGPITEILLELEKEEKSAPKKEDKD